MEGIPCPSAESARTCSSGRVDNALPTGGVQRHNSITDFGEHADKKWEKVLARYGADVALKHGHIEWLRS